MTPLFKKLNFKNQGEIFVLNFPESFHNELEVMREVTRVSTELYDGSVIEFVLAFGTRQEDVDKFAQAIETKLKGDAIVWFAYPKGSSKKYKCEFNRDTGWQALGDRGFEPVRMIALDEDWSALRFRKVENIKKMTRAFAMSDEGKKKTGKV